MSCADPETFVWRAGYYRPYSGFAIEMAFRWPADCGPTLNADFVALRVLVRSKPVLLRDPIVLWFLMGPHPPHPWKRAWMYSNPENFTLIDDIPSTWHSSTNKSHVSNIYGSRGGEWGSGHPTYTDKHIHMRARVLADHRDVGLLRNTGIGPLPPPWQFKKLSNQHYSVRQRNTWSPPLEATIWIRVCNYLILTVCKWMLAFLK